MMTEEQMDNNQQGNLRLIEAVLFASTEPMTVDRLQKQVGADADVPALLAELQSHYSQHGVNLVSIDGAWGFRTAPDLAARMKIVMEPRRKLPRAASEVLAIIAYHQPVTRGEIESIRGVETSKGTLDLLLELGWVRPGQKRQTPGYPLNWHTTTDFLSHFNLTSVNDLPGVEELKAAGLLDTRMVLDNSPREKEAADIDASHDDSRDFAEWIEQPADKAEGA